MNYEYLFVGLMSILIFEFFKTVYKIISEYRKTLKQNAEDELRKMIREELEKKHLKGDEE